MLKPKKPLKQLIQNAFKKGTEKSEMKKKMPQVNAEKARFEEKTKSANDNAARYKAPNATVSKVNFEREKWEKGLSGNVPMGSGSKAKEYKSFDNMPRMKMKQTKSYKG
jgi:hypothetical protein